MASPFGLISASSFIIEQNGAMADDDVKRFAALLRQKEQNERAAEQKERDDRAAAKRLAAATKAKEDAAEGLREARRSGKTDRIAEADAAYRAALAELVEIESGKRPEWAPAVVEPVVEPDVEPVAADELAAEPDTPGEADTESAELSPAVE
jgi:ATP-dependent exoDNAse (exonuclease V) alpha subunit